MKTVFSYMKPYRWPIAIAMLEDIALDTFLQKEDHLNEFAKKARQIPKIFALSNATVEKRYTK